MTDHNVEGYYWRPAGPKNTFKYYLSWTIGQILISVDSPEYLHSDGVLINS